jgi:hypothetical protein
MSTITTPSTQVNAPTPTTSTDPWASAMLKIEKALEQAGFQPRYECVDHVDGYKIMIGGFAAFVAPDLGVAKYPDEHDELPEHDDTLPPDAEDASYARWADGYLHDLDVEEVARVAFRAILDQRPPMTDAEVDAFYSDCGPGAVPAARRESPRQVVRIGYAADRDAC